MKRKRGGGSGLPSLRCVWRLRAASPEPGHSEEAGGTPAFLACGGGAAGFGGEGACRAVENAARIFGAGGG